MSIALRPDLSRLERLPRAMRVLADADRRELLDSIGGVVVSQAQRRIATEKRGPDGVPWPVWSPDYARTRHGGQSLLVAQGHLLQSVQQALRSEEVEVGSNLAQAAILQEGGRAGRGHAAVIPPRPYLGLSADDQAEILAVVDAWLDDLLDDMSAEVER